MSWTYRCPHCSVMLNPEQAIILVAAREESRVLVGFHPEPGNYEVHLPPGFDAEAGSRWRFFCPVCHEDLVTDEADGLCAIDMETVGAAHRVFFSPVAGEKATFVISAEGLRSSYGHDFKKFLREVGWGPKTV